VNLHLKSFATQRTQHIAVLAMVAVLFVAGCSKTENSPMTQATQKTFATPAEASQALHAAVKGADDKALTQVLGAKAQKLVSSGDPAEDKSAADSFAQKYEQMNRLVAMTDGSQVLYVGADNYPFPVPLAQDGSSRWYFDAVAAEEELRARRIGGNELSAMDICRLIADAEELYHHKTREYTATIISTPGKQDGLYWQASQDQELSPLARVGQFGKGIFNTPAPGNTVVSHGYTFNVVTTQKGFTVFASPVHYQQSGIMTLSLGRDGVIYQQDLGPNTAGALAAMEQYNPTEGWTQAE
jgi:Protein of unknown function (DUF2950)